MRARIFGTFIVFLLACAAVRNLAQEKPDVAAIRVLEAKWTDSYKQRDITTLSTLLAEDYVITTEDGNTYGKVGFISHFASPLRIDTAEMSDLKIRLHDNIAVVTGAYHEKGDSAGKPYDYHDRMTDVWMKISGKWQLIVSHYSLSASP